MPAMTHTDLYLLFSAGVKFCSTCHHDFYATSHTTCQLSSKSTVSWLPLAPTRTVICHLCKKALEINASE